ncbi:CubicO group peptidase, beta-lactamase class C family [Algoriphagus locisalis]|uniref:CubicO group peptidase, beta-lactamase class C family n=1 Tax=Algoriphagus locisalis TaxID=305507 RepID=A0A1I6YNN9_9BACT|nr:serine hydrolase domain-containing protein [Algoriphagus locisalis]SFT52063.1 CubicO group peptidase, beta-lactamase class C family [Algoriphagus locisalis]
MKFIKPLGKLLLATFLFFSLCLQQVYPQSLESRIDSLLQATFTPKGPGAVFLVAKDGKVIYQKAFGMANLELEVPMTPNNVFEIGSMTKQFTAVAILMLVEQSKLQLDDEITKFIPDYPTQGKNITLHHLLTHTSGIKSFTSMKSIRDIERQDLTPIELIDFFKNEPMDFEPGQEFKYNNSGYVILGYIIEILSGESYADFIEKNIFQKLEMNSSQYASYSEVIKNRAYGYHQKDEFMNKNFVSLSLPYSSGSLMSTATDMLEWNEAIKNNTLLKPESTAKAFENCTLNNGENINYGYGWHISNLNESPSYEHGGSIFGFKSMGVYLPEEDIYVIGLSNCDCNSPTVLTRDIAKLTLQNY